MSITTKFTTKSELAVYDQSQGCLRICVSAPVPDRDDEIVDPTNLRLDAYRLNPVVLYGHDPDTRFPVGKCEGPNGDFRVWIDGQTLWAEFYFANTQQGQEVAELYRQKVLRGASIGFRSDGLEDVSPQEAERLYGVRKRLQRHVGGELLEISCVPVPCNPVALAAGWIDPVLSANVVSRGWVSDPSRPLSSHVLKSLSLKHRVGSGFPRKNGSFKHHRGVINMAEQNIEKKSEDVSVKADASNPVDEQEEKTEDGGTSPEDMDPIELVKAGIAAAAGSALASVFTGEIDWDEVKSQLDEFVADYRKYNGDDEKESEEESEDESEEKDSDESSDDDEKSLVDLIRKAVRDEVQSIKEELDGVTDVLDMLTSKR